MYLGKVVPKYLPTYINYSAGLMYKVYLFLYRSRTIKDNLVR